MRKRPKYTKGMNEIRRLLDKIGRQDTGDYSKNHAIWMILSALRGPDNGNQKLKSYTTARLRLRVCRRSWNLKLLIAHCLVKLEK